MSTQPQDGGAHSSHRRRATALRFKKLDISDRPRGKPLRVEFVFIHARGTASLAGAHKHGAQRTGRARKGRLSLKAVICRRRQGYTPTACGQIL